MEFENFPTLAKIAVILALVLTAVVTLSAVRSINSPFASLMIDPYGAFSSPDLPYWETNKLGLVHPDQIISVNGQNIGLKVEYGDFPIDRFNRILTELSAEGHTSVSLEFLKSGKNFKVESSLQQMGILEFCLFFLNYSLMALMMF